MKTLIFLISLFIICVSTFAQLNRTEPETALQNINLQPTNILGCGPEDRLLTCIAKVSANILKILVAIAAVTGAAMYILAGITYMTKGQEEGAQKNVKSKIIYGTIGLVIALLAWSLVLFLSNIAKQGLVYLF